MKIITLNAWGARVGESFFEFIEKYKDIDIFCLQEIYNKSSELMLEEYPDSNHNLFSRLVDMLPNHKGFFRPSLQGVYGIAIFIKKDLKVEKEGEVIIHIRNQVGTINDGHHDRNMQWIKFNHDNKNFIVMNVHGLWNGRGKNDVPERIAQSTIIRKFMDETEGSKILCGDFNLNPDTESVKILEKDMKNLVRDYSVPTTRTSLYFNKPNKTEKFADYIFTSPDIVVKDFKVLPEEVSDHAGLYLEI